MELDQRVLKCPLCAGTVSWWAAKSRAGQEFQYDRCWECGFAFVNPRPTMLALSRYYSAPIPDAAANDSSLPSTLQITRPVIPAEQRQPGKWPTKAIAQILRLRPGPGHLLDVGAGDGTFSLAAIRAGLEVTALEVDPVDLPALRSIPGIHFVEQMFEGFDSPPESFEYVLMSHVLEHVHEPRAWIEKAARLLRPGGILAIMAPHFDSIYRLLGGTRDPYFIPPDHLNHFNVRSLSRLSERFGLWVVKVETTSEFKNDVITKRLAFPKPLVPAMRGVTTGISKVLDWGTWALGIGSVMNFYARKE
jgi:SAM-dependent methyltransferase